MGWYMFGLIKIKTQQIQMEKSLIKDRR